MYTFDFQYLDPPLYLDLVTTTTTTTTTSGNYEEHLVYYPNQYRLLPPLLLRLAP